MNKYSNFLCFEGNTHVATANGIRPIKDIKLGTEIIAFNEKSKTISYDIVTTIAKSLHSLCAIIKFEDGTSLKATVDHPLYIVGKGWCAVNVNRLEEMYGVSVEQLEEGDVCLSINNGELSHSRVISIEVNPCSELFYCLATKNNHSFFANGILAHDVDINRFSQEILQQEGVVVERTC